MNNDDDVRGLLPYNSVIQVCPVCGKVDVSKDDGHDCDSEAERQENDEYYD
jgi:hypothetical protein